VHTSLHRLTDSRTTAVRKAFSWIFVSSCLIWHWPLFHYMSMEHIELQGETLAFYFICGVFCLIGWVSWFFGSRCAYRYGAICMDRHCWCPAVCVCVSEVFTLSLSGTLIVQSYSVCLCLLWAYRCRWCILQWVDLLDVPLWRLTWEV
jgi:hypothetical protein